MVETVEGYKCEECKDNKNKARKQVIGYASEILTVQLKRMDWTGRKIMTHVNIDPVLDLTRYREAGNEDSMKYELTSVVKHRGTLASGHYIAYAKGPDDIWYEYDDRKKSVSSLGFAVGSRDKWTPYLLFFQRKK
jgi:ubiquitin C-terminal hydrolase